MDRTSLACYVYTFANYDGSVVTPRCVEVTARSERSCEWWHEAVTRSRWQRSCEWIEETLPNVTYQKVKWSTTTNNGTTTNEGTRGSLVRMTPDVVYYSWQLSIRVFEGIWIDMNWICFEKDYSDAKFLYSYTEPISLKKAHSTKWKAFGNKTLHLYNHSLFLRYLDWIFFKLPNAFHFVEWDTQQWTIEYQELSYRYWPSVNKQH